MNIQEKAHLVRRIKNCKTLRSIHLDDRDYEQLPYDLRRFHFDRIALKAFKPFHKYLKNYSIWDCSKKVEKPLQNLSVVKIHPEDCPLNLKSTFRKINFEKIIFPFDADHYSRKYDREVEAFLNFLSQMRHKLVRHIQKLRKIKEIEIHVTSYSFKILAALVEILQQNPLLIPSLKNFKIITQRINPSNTLEILPAESSQIQSILPYITFLQIWHHKWMSTPILFENFRNIQELRIDCKSNDLNEYHFNTQFPALKNLTKLRSFKLEFSSSSRQKEKAFIESFTLPISIERVELILVGFKWKSGELTKENKELVEKSFKEHTRYINFFSQWENLPNLKELYLTIEEDDKERDSSSICAAFAINIFKQVETLTQVALLNTVRNDQFFFETAIKAIKAVEFKNIWESLMPSKKTLKIVKISTPEINFASSVNSLETSLPNLESFSLLGTVYLASEVFDFGRALLQHQKKEKNSLQLTVRNMKIHELERLKLFFNSLQINIPTCLEGQIDLDMKELKGEIWVEDFCEFMQKFKTGATICLALFNVSIASSKAVQKVRSAIENNRAFSSFSMRCIFRGISYFGEDEGEYQGIQDLVYHGFVKEDS